MWKEKRFILTFALMRGKELSDGVGGRPVQNSVVQEILSLLRMQRDLVTRWSRMATRKRSPLFGWEQTATFSTTGTEYNQNLNCSLQKKKTKPFRFISSLSQVCFPFPRTTSFVLNITKITQVYRRMALENSKDGEWLDWPSHVGKKQGAVNTK